MPTVACQRDYSPGAPPLGSTYPERILLVPKGFVDAHGAVCADGYLARGFVEGDGLERLLVVIVYGLKKGVGVTEYRKGIACDVGLGNSSVNKQAQGQQAG